MTYLLSDKLYKALKWLGLIALPAVAVFTAVVGKVWGWPDVDAWVTTINALGVLVGALIGVSTATGKEPDAGEDGR